jgi:hypothetical protein
MKRFQNLNSDRVRVKAKRPLKIRKVEPLLNQQ